ncbi:MAG: tRNA lysidine(34) synthetase TilS [Succinivibrio sp.]
MLKEKAQQVVDSLADKIISTVAPSLLVVGLSGGADSTLALIVGRAVAQKDPRFSVLAVHCIHGLDADDPIWLEHCTKLCRRLEVKLVTPKLNIVYGNGRSPEEVSRSERYSALFSNAGENGILLLGHQADDQVENFLLALKRGSGPYGLSGMQFLTQDNRGRIIRPLLEYSKQEIIEIIESLGFDHVFDISNTYLKFERNFIRLKVLPLLKERFAGIDGSILRSAKLCAIEHDLATRYAKKAFDSCFEIEHNRLNLEKLDLSDEALSLLVIRMFLSKFQSLPPEYSIVRQTIALCEAGFDQHGLIMLGDKKICRFRNYLYVVPDLKKPEKTEVTIKAGETVKLGDYRYSLNENSISSAILDFNYSGSLKLHPVGRNHSREVKKLFAEYDVPVWERGAQPLVLDASDRTVLSLGSLFRVRNPKLPEMDNSPLLSVTACRE